MKSNKWYAHWQHEALQCLFHDRHATASICSAIFEFQPVLLSWQWFESRVFRPRWQPSDLASVRGLISLSWSSFISFTNSGTSRRKASRSWTRFKRLGQTDMTQSALHRNEWGMVKIASLSSVMTNLMIHDWPTHFYLCIQKKTLSIPDRAASQSQRPPSKWFR